MGLVAVWLCDEGCYLHCFSEVKILESDWLGAVAVAVFYPAPFYPHQKRQPTISPLYRQLCWGSVIMGFK